MYSLQYWLPDEELDRVMAKYDVDNSGAIDFDEFTSIVYDGLLLDGK
jgi:Ca2+-binding EF-hand superfamily protein